VKLFSEQNVLIPQQLLSVQLDLQEINGKIQNSFFPMSCSKHSKERRVQQIWNSQCG